MMKYETEFERFSLTSPSVQLFGHEIKKKFEQQPKLKDVSQSEKLYETKLTLDRRVRTVKMYF